jgi:hypothetical protein
MRPTEQFLPRLFAGKYPENFIGPLAFELTEQIFQIFETGNALNIFALYQTPKYNHQAAVSDRQISPKHGASI